LLLLSPVFPVGAASATCGFGRNAARLRHQSVNGEALVTGLTALLERRYWTMSTPSSICSLDDSCSSLDCYALRTCRRDKCLQSSLDDCSVSAGDRRAVRSRPGDFLVAACLLTHFPSLKDRAGSQMSGQPHYALRPKYPPEYSMQDRNVIGKST